MAIVDRVSCILRVRLTLSGSFSNCRCIIYKSCRNIAINTTMDGSVGNVSRLKPVDARQQPTLASTTNALEAVLQKNFPVGRALPYLLHCCSSSPNSTPPPMPEIMVSTIQHRCFPPKAPSPSPHTAVNWLSMDSLHTTMAIDGQLAHSIATDNGHR